MTTVTPGRILARLSLLVLPVLLLACATTDRPVEVHKSANDARDYRYLELDNGLKVLLVHSPESEVSAISLAVGAGSYQNPEAFPGLAHYLEHMLFLGTENYPEANALQQFVERQAGRTNAYVTRDHTNYFFQIPTEHLDPALDRFSDYFKAPLFDRDYSDKERTAIHNEWTMGRNQDPRILQQLAGLTANPEHPAARFSVGNRETLPGGEGSGLYQAMLDFYERYYSANLMSLVAVSQHSLDEQQAMIEHHFDAVPNRGVEPPRVEVPGIEPEQQGRHIYYVPQQERRQLIIEFPLADNSDQWRQKPNEYLSNLLSSEEPGTLGHYLREQNLANTMTVQVQPDFYGEDGFLRVNVDATSQGMEQRDRIIAATLAYIELARQQGVDSSYYDEYREFARRQFANQAPPQPLQQAAHLSVALHRLPPAYVNSAWAYYGDFDPGPIRAVLDQLRPERMRLWHIGLEEPVDTAIPYYAGHYSVLDISPQELTRWQTLAAEMDFQLPPENEFAGTEAAEEVEHSLEEMTQLVSEPGVEAWFQHAEHHRDGRALAHFVFNTDLGIASDEHYVMGLLLNHLLQETNTSLVDRAARAGVDIRFGRSRSNMQTLTVSGPAENHPALIEQLLDSVAGLEIRARDLDRARERLRERIAGEANDAPMRQLSRMLERRTHAFDWDADRLLAASEQVTAEQLEDYHRQLRTTSRVRLYAYGHYRPEQVQAMAYQAHDSLGESRNPGSLVLDPIQVPEPGETWGWQEAIDHSDVGWMEVHLVQEPSIEALAELLLLNSLIGNPFYDQLRTQEQWGYAVGANATRIGEHAALLFLVQSSERNLTDIAERVAQFREEYLPLLEEVASDEVEQLRRSLLAQLTQTPNDFYTEANRYLQDFYRNNTDFDTRDRLIAALEQVTRQDLIERYRSLMESEGQRRIILQVKGSAFADDAFYTSE